MLFKIEEHSSKIVKYKKSNPQMNMRGSKLHFLSRLTYVYHNHIT